MAKKKSGPVESFVHAQNLERTPPAKGIRWLYGYCALSMRFVRYSSVPCPVLLRSHPVLIGGPDTRPDCYLIING